MSRREKTELEVETPPGFDFRRTLRSHGWYDLPPFELVADDRLARVPDVGREAPVTVFVRECGDRKIARFYSRFGEWRGLALWCDMTRDWFEEDSGQ